MYLNLTFMNLYFRTGILIVYDISKLSAKYQFCTIHTADNTDGKVTGGGKNFTAGRNLPLHRYALLHQRRVDVLIRVI